MGAVTLIDVARRAGVSQPTASRVLNGSARSPAPQVVEAVQKAAADLGYVPNAQAQALARSSTGLLGLVVHDIADPYFSTIAAGIESVAAAHGMQMLMTSTFRNVTSEVAAVEAFMARRADAIIMVGSRWTTLEAAEAAERLATGLARYTSHRGRVAVIGQPAAWALAAVGAPTHAVVPENREGAAALARALMDAGHREFVILSGPQSLVTAADRTAGFIDALAEQNLRPLAVIPGEFTRDGGYNSARQILQSASPVPPCVFAVNDVMALGAMAALREAGLGIPNDAYVAGFDDIPTLRDHRPGLTTVRLPLHAMGRRAAELALTGATREVTVERVRGEVVLRDSTALGGFRSRASEHSSSHRSSLNGGD
jgi:LacI family transcriptional regulator